MATIYAFGPFRLDVEAEILFRGTEPVTLGQRAVGLLRALVERPGTPIARDVLIGAVWPGLAVEDSNLNVQIAALRRALGEEPGGDRWVETLPRRGYRFVGPIVATLDGAVSAGAPIGTADDAASQGPGTARMPSTRPERRQLTLMSSELVGAAGRIGLELEDLREVIDAYHRCLAHTVGPFGGLVDKHFGNTVLVYFGYPAAHEDDVEQAVRAGLALCRAVKSLKADAMLRCRVGIATGPVIVDDLGGDVPERRIVGEVPNIAARLQISAQPDTVVIDETTQRLVGKLFDCRNLGKVEAAGVADPVPAWQALRAGIVESRFEALHPVLTPLVGREEELELLRRRWRCAKQGEGRVVLICGEPGIGKSRLVAAFEEIAQTDTHIRIRYFSSPHHANSALYPVVAQLKAAAGLEPADTSAQKFARFDALLASSATKIQHAVALLANLLSLQADDRYPLPEMSPQKRKEQTFAILMEHIAGLAARQPVLMVFEDVHWLDPTSLELLASIVECVPSLPLLVVVTFRPEFDPPWVGRPNLTMMPLNRLDLRQRATLVHRVAGNRVLPAKIVDEIVNRTDGVPLFVEELTKAVLEASADDAQVEKTASTVSSPMLAVPATLHASLTARLDRVGPAKEIAQIGATIGREFSYELLSTVVGHGDEELRLGLDRLTEAGLLFCRGAAPHSNFQFKHALVRDAAYETLLKSRRQQLHGHIARALEQRCPDIVATQPEIVAHHFTEAGLPEPAINYWRRAGEHALGRSASAEAVEHLTKGIELVRGLPSSAERDRMELDLQMPLGPAMAATRGAAAPETVQVFCRVRDLLGDSGSLSDRMNVLVALCIMRGMDDHVAAYEVAQQCLSLATRHQHDGALACANRFMGMALFSMGAFVEARQRLEQTLEPSAAKEKIALHFLEDDHIYAQVFLAWTLWILGRPGQAGAMAAQALADVPKIGHAVTTAMALLGEARLSLLRDDLDSAAAQADRAMAHCVEYGLADWGHWMRFIQGRCLARDDPQHGIEIMRNVMAGLEAIGVKRGRPMHLAYLADAYVSVGRPELGLGLLDEAIQTAEAISEKYFKAELYRLQGKMLLTIGKQSDAEISFYRALTVARQQSAKFWELRAASSLARHWHDVGRDAEARNMLAPVYEWFNEGFELPALRKARTLLDELKRKSPHQSMIPSTGTFRESPK